MKRTHGLDEREVEQVKHLTADCQTTGDIQAKLKQLFAGTIERMPEAKLTSASAMRRTPLLATTPETVVALNEI